MKNIWSNITKVTIFTSLLIGLTKEPIIFNEPLANFDTNSSKCIKSGLLGQEPKFKNVNEKIFIFGLGDVDNSMLEEASKILESFYGYDGVVMGKLQSNPKYFFKDSDIVCADCFLANIDSDIKKIVITDKDLYCVDGTKLRGYTYLNGKNVLIKGNMSFLRETLIHEMGHTLGLRHCADLTCIMAIHNDSEDSGDFCNKCKKVLNIK